MYITIPLLKSQVLVLARGYLYDSEDDFQPVWRRLMLAPDLNREEIELNLL